MPTPKTLLQIADTPNTSGGTKRKISDDTSDSCKRSKVDESSSSTEIESTSGKNDNVIGSAILIKSAQSPNVETELTSEELPSQTKTQTSKYARLLEQKSIVLGAELDPDSLPQTK